MSAAEPCDEHELGDPLPDVMPTNEKVGELFLFAFYMRQRAEELTQHAERIMRHLHVLGEIPENAALKGTAVV